ETSLPAHREVMLTHKHQALNHLAIAIFSRDDNCLAQFISRKIYSEKITRNCSVCRKHDQTARMRVLIRLRIISKVKTRFARDFLDRDLVAGQKMPAILCLASPVKLDVFSLLPCG